MTPLWTRKSVLVFFLVGFGVPWLGWTTLAVSDIPRSSGLARLLFYTGDFMTVGGFVAAYVAAGRPGVASLFRRYVDVRGATIPWALFALLLPLAWTILGRLSYGATHGGIGRFEIGGLAQMVTAGAWLAWTTGPLGEEAGWRGFFLPRLAARYRPVATALILGIIWSVWHFPLYYSRFADGPLWVVHFSIGTICFSLLMAVLWAHSRGSVFWAIVMHWSINVMPGVAAAMFPDIRPPRPVAEWLQDGALIVATVLVAVAVGLRRLQSKTDVVIGSLTAEAIDADRRLAP